MRWVVGDLQGCYAEFEALLESIKFNESTDEIWCAGDIVNRGPKTLETLRLWRSVGGKGVIGNHEIYALCAASGQWPRKDDTLSELFADDERDTYLQSLRDLPALAYLPSQGDGPNAWLVHGGVDPNWEDLHSHARRINDQPHDDAWLNCDDVSFVTRVRFCNGAGLRTRFSGPADYSPEGFRPWDDFYRGDELVVHGHWARRGFYRTEKSMGLDSGCVYGNVLTAWCQDEDRIVRIPNKGSRV